MGKISICDVCGGDLNVDNQHAEFKLPKGYWRKPQYDGATSALYMSKSKLDICFTCWHKFRDWVQSVPKLTKDI